MDCEQAVALLVADMDREMLPDDRARLLAHLKDCAACGATADALRLQDADLRRGFASRRRAAAAVADRVIAEIRTVPLQRRRAWFPWVLALTSAAAGFLLALVLFRPWKQTVPQPPEVVEQTPPSPKVVKQTPPSQEAGPKPANIPVALPPSPVVQLALVSRKDGSVQVQAPGEKQWKAVKVGAALVGGSRVRTGKDLRCELQSPDGSAVRLNSNTELIVLAPRQFKLDRGQMLARVAHTPAADSFQVHLADAKVTAVGTEFDIQHDPTQTVLNVLEGKTRIDIKDSSPRTIDQGWEARIQGGKLIQLQKSRSRKAVDWTRELMLLKKRDDPEALAYWNQKIFDDLFAHIGQAKMAVFPEDEIRSLGDHCVLPLTRYLESERSKPPEEWQKRITAARILSDLAQPWSIPDLIGLLEDSDGEVRFYSARALKRLTGISFAGEPENWRDLAPDQQRRGLQQWRAWREKNKNRYPSMPQ